MTEGKTNYPNLIDADLQVQVGDIFAPITSEEIAMYPVELQPFFQMMADVRSNYQSFEEFRQNWKDYTEVFAEDYLHLSIQ
jgi:hypothetical protein